MAIGYRHTPVEGPPAGPALPLWGRVALYVPIQVGLYVGAEMVLTLVGLLLQAAKVLPGPEALLSAPEALFGLEALWAAASLGLTALFWLSLDRRPWVELGLRAPRPREWPLALLLGLAPLAVTLPVVLATGHLRFFGFAASVPFVLYRAAMYAALSLAVAFAEEVPFRGYLLPNLSQRLGRPAAILLVTLLFVAFHLADPDYRRPLSFLNVAIVGTGLALLRLGTGGLALPILTHAVYDFSLFTFVGDPDLPGIFRRSIGPETLWLGGEHAAGLLDIGITFLWLAAIYWGIYLPARAPKPL